MRQTRNVTFALLVGMGLIAAWFAIDKFARMKEPSFSEQERSFLAKYDAFIGSQVTIVALSTLTEFDWTKVCTFGPYTERATFESRLGVRAPDFDELKWFRSDSEWGFAFSDENSNTKVIRLLGPNHGYLEHPTDSILCTTSSAAVIKKRLDSHGNYLVYLTVK